MILRVFPRRTKATPDDEYVRIGFPNSLDPSLGLPEDVNKIEISVSFTWDIPLAERMYHSWKYVCKTEMGGPALNTKGEEFEPGKYLKKGYVITSRGCNNNCWFCSVPKREGKIRELEIKDGYNVLDDNLLATSWIHFLNVCRMLKKQNRAPELTGGLEAAILTPGHALELFDLHPKSLFFAYDTLHDRDPLFEAGILLRSFGFKFSSHTLRCYVLIGYPNDTFEKAEKRLNETLEAGFIPMAMLYRNETGETKMKWKQFQRLWARPGILFGKLRNENKIFE